MIRIGNGYDVHAFCKGDFITLGGVKIPYQKGLEAHSDGDVLIHALCDALLGALALGDIGHHFPDNDGKFKNIDSRVLLQHINKIMTINGYRLNNCDCTVVAQSPKLAPYIEDMRKNLSVDLNTNINDVSVKATTTEKLGFIGKSQGIAVYAVVLLESVDKTLSA